MRVFLRPALLACLLALAGAGPSAGEAAALTLDGTFEQGGMVIGQAVPGSTVTLDGKPVRITPDGHFVFGFGRDHGSSALVEVVTPDGEREVRALDVAARDYDIQRIDGLPQGKVSGFSDEDLARIRRDNAQVAAARAAESDATDFLQHFIWPAKGTITGVYGSQRILNGEPRRPHYGLDIAGPTGTPVVAPAAGTVTLAETNHFFTGGIVIIDHGYGINSTLFHMNTVEVEVGQRVAQGEQVGTIGATGRATGPHVDWRVNWYAERLDPQFLVSGTPD